MNARMIPRLLTLEELQQKVTAGEVDNVAVGFTDHYGRLMGKRFDTCFFLEQIAAHGTHACNYLLTFDMEMEPVPGYAFASSDLGYGDVRLVSDLTTLRVAAWLDRMALVLCDVHDARTDAPAPIAPRSILALQPRDGAGPGCNRRWSREAPVRPATPLMPYQTAASTCRCPELLPGKIEISCTA